MDSILANLFFVKDAHDEIGEDAIYQINLFASAIFSLLTDDADIRQFKCLMALTVLEAESPQLSDGALTRHGAFIAYVFRFFRVWFSRLYCRLPLTNVSVRCLSTYFVCVKEHDALPTLSLVYALDVINAPDTRYFAYMHLTASGASDMARAFRSCAKCGDAGARHVCERCKIVRYCNKGHEWSFGRSHQLLCRHLRATHALVQ